MIDIKFARENLDLLRSNLQKKNEKSDIDILPKLDERRREIIRESENLKNTRNVVSKEIADLKRKKENADDKIAAMRDVSAKIKSMDEELKEINSKLKNLMLTIPNILEPDVPAGQTEDDNIEVRSWGEPAKQKISKNHIDIAKDLNIIDFERGAKVSGAGFSFYKGKGAKLERALINYMIDHHIDNNGYSELMPPFMVNENSMYGTGQLPKMGEDMYHCEEDNMYLIPTAEVPITNFHGNEILSKDDLPIKYCGYSPCFRREAGSYGKEVHGFLRVHQFNKVELVNFSEPDKSNERLNDLVGEAESILKELGLHYRLLLLCSGDTSFSSAKTYDLEVWAAGEEKWLEVSSCSNFKDFQSRRANIKYKPKPDSKPEFVHTLNGSGLATSRIMVAILENYIQEDGSVLIPEPLRKYTGFDKISK